MGENANNTGNKMTFPWKLGVIFLLFSVIIIVMGIYYYRYERNRIFEEQEKSLSAIASLKIKQISQWYADKLADAILIKDNEPLIARVKQFINDENQTGIRKEIGIWLEALNTQYDYNSVAILDTFLKVRIATSNADPMADDSIRKEINNVIRYHKIIMTDLHKTGSSHSIRMNLLVPLLDHMSKEPKTIGIVILCIDPDKILFPLVQSWPTPSRSSETLILRKEGDSVLYLNELRHRKNTALNLKLPLNKVNLLATKAVNGFEGVTEGNDYRNVPVIGALSKIQGLPWFMVAKTDKEEILAPFKRYSVITVLVIILLILINASIFGFWIWQQRIKFYANQLKSEISILELEERFTEAFRMSPVSVTISSITDSKFIDVNNTFLEDMEYKREEVIGMTAKDLDIWADEKEREWIINEINEKGKVFGKVASFRTRTGKVIYGLVSISIIKINGEPYNLSTVVNITERKHAEDLLLQNESLLQKIIDNANSLIYLVDTEGRFLMVNEPLLSLLSATREQLLGKTREAFLPKEIADIHRYNDMEVLKSGKTQIFEEENIQTDGNHFYLTTKFPILNNQKEVSAIGGLSTDITERKKAEEKLMESEEHFRKLFENMLNGYAYCRMIHEDGQLPDFQYINVNEAFKSLTGLKEVEGKRVSEVIPGIQESDKELLEKYGRVAQTGRSEMFEMYVESLKMWFSISVYSPKKEFFVAVFDVITERKKSEEALRESEDKFKYIFDHSVIGKSITLPSGEMDVNNAFCDMLGYRKDELEKTKWQDITHPDDIEMNQNAINSLITGEKDSIRFIKRYIHKNGSVVWTDVGSTLRRDENGKPLYFLTAINDITELKRAEDALRESEEKFKYIFEHSALGNSITNPTGKTHFNNAFCEMLGYRADELENLKWQDFTHPDDFEITQKVVDSLFSGESDAPRFIKRYIRKDGSIMWADVSTSLRYDKDKTPLYFMTTINDITELKLAEEILRNDEKRFRELIEALPQLFWTCRVDGPCDYLSKQWIEYTGIPESEQLGYAWLKQIHPEDKERTISDWNEKVKNGNVFDVEFRIRRYDAEYHWFKTRAIPILDAEDKIIRWLGSNTDTDSIRKAEDQLKNYSKDLEHRVIQRTEQLQSANTELESFSYSVSHDLRAPLRAIHSFTSILRQDYGKILDEEGNRICSIIETSSIHMGQLIDDLLAFSRVGRTALEHIDINMGKLAETVYAELTKPEERKRITFIVRKLPKASGDAVMMRQLLVNLISNALKYTSKKETANIVVGSESDDNEIIYYVRDDGAGFDMQYSNKLFGVFQRLHSDKEFDGNGVGLAIVQRIVKRHDGRVWAEGEKGKGATFYFALPVKKVNSGTQL